MWHVPDKGSQLGCHIRPVNSGDTDLVSSSGPTWRWFMFPAVFFRGALWWGGSFNQHDEPCHPLRMHTQTLTHTWGSGHMLRGSGPAAVPSLVQTYTESCWHMSKELHSTYRRHIRIMQRQHCLYQHDCQRVEGGTDENECMGEREREEGQSEREAGTNPNEVFLI